MARFQPHGRVTAHVEGSILFFETSGPYNVEAVEAILSAYRPLLVQLAGRGRFGHITVFHRSMLATPDSLEAFGRLIADWRTAGLQPVANAYVAGGDVEGRSIMMPVFERVFTGAAPFRDFLDVASAERWMSERLANG